MNFTRSYTTQIGPLLQTLQTWKGFIIRFKKLFLCSALAWCFEQDTRGIRLILLLSDSLSGMLMEVELQRLQWI
jgi:hypothetical protein